MIVNVITSIVADFPSPVSGKIYTRNLIDTLVRTNYAPGEVKASLGTADMSMSQDESKALAEGITDNSFYLINFVSVNGQLVVRLEAPEDIARAIISGKFIAKPIVATPESIKSKVTIDSIDYVASIIVEDIS